MSACPQCAYYGSKVTMTRRLWGGWIKRWRKCLQDNCDTKWTTLEMPSEGVEPPEGAAPEFFKELHPQHGGNDG